ncbi:MAG: insulinase family protein, partial [Candidatus Cloacimonetes bacterium]|nr:insulinase family protein [Candidatus Cloacimonadota bacterium]
IDSIKVHSLSGINSGASIILVMPKKNADLTKICKIILEELEQFYRFGINELELKDHKKELIFFYRYSFEYVESLAASLGCEEILTAYENLFKYPDIIEKINNSKLNQIISKYFNKNHLYIFHYGNRKFDKTEVKKRLDLVDKKISKITFKKNFYETRLDNGMKVLLKKVYGKPTIGISLSYEVSQLNESKSNRGLNLLTSGLMLYGNEKRNYQQFLNYCTSNGINFGITPQSETTSVKLKCFKEMLPMSLELLSEVALTPVFPSDFFHNLQQSYSSNLDRVKDYPNHYAAKLWKEMIFGKQSNIIDRTGSKTSLKKISLTQIKNWYKNFYHPGNMSLSIVGDFNFEEVLKSFEKLFVSNIKSGKISVQKPIIESLKNRKKRTLKKMDQSVINIGGFGCTAMETQKNTAFHILAQIIGGDTNSILFNELREKRGLAYFVEFNFHSIRSLGFWVASAIVDKKRESEAINMIHTVLQDIKKNGIQNRDLEKTKNYIRGQRLMEEESMLNQAHTLSVLESIGFGYEYYLKWEERLNKVNLKALQNIAEEYFNESEYFVHVLS